MRLSKLFHVVFCLTTLVFPLASEAGSFSLNEQSVSGLGVAFAGGAAQAEDASTLFFNPAGIVLLPQGELQTGLHLIMPSAEFHNEGSRTICPARRSIIFRSRVGMAATAASSTPFRIFT